MPFTSIVTVTTWFVTMSCHHHVHFVVTFGRTTVHHDTIDNLARDRPLESFRVNRDLYEGYFVVIHPSEEHRQRPLWIARALSNPNSNLEHPSCVLIQYFRPTSRTRSIQEFYTGWDSETDLHWKVDSTLEETWESTNSILTTWKSATEKDTTHCVLKIPPRQIEIIC